jgi:hypothetical protein
MYGTEDEIPITYMRKIIRGSWAMEQNKASELTCHDEILNSRMVQQYWQQNETKIYYKYGMFTA